MGKIVVVSALLLASGLVLASTSWQPKSWDMKNGTVRTILAGWELTHFPDSKAEALTIAKNKKPLAAVTDYPDSLEIRAFIGDSGEFITVRDKDHDRRYEEIEGLEDGTTLKLGGDSYRLTNTNGTWSLNISQ